MWKTFGLNVYVGEEKKCSFTLLSSSCWFRITNKLTQNRLKINLISCVGKIIKILLSKWPKAGSFYNVLHKKKKKNYKMLRFSHIKKLRFEFLTSKEFKQNLYLGSKLVMKYKVCLHRLSCLCCSECLSLVSCSREDIFYMVSHFLYSVKQRKLKQFSYQLFFK